MKKFSFIVMVLGLVVAAIIFVVIWNGRSSFRTAIDNLPLLSPADIIRELGEQVSAPKPLVQEKPLPKSYLTRAGIVYWTNVQRKDQSLAMLRQNSQLDAAAALRIDDMFAKQYFAHFSPSGDGAKQAVIQVGYEFILLGENLALGDFEKDSSLVQAWMDSPGHRANILDARYTEIGVAVKKGKYQGRETWIAVQIFALPRSACQEPSASLKQQIISSKQELEQTTKTATALREELEASHPRTREEVQAYNNKVKIYNVLVDQIRALNVKIKEFVGQYNAQVDAFNRCASP